MPSADQRVRPRRRTRLRAGKVLDGRNRFLAECVVHDLSDTGARLRLMRDIGLPQQFRLYDDDEATLMAVQLVWRRGLDVGVRFRWTGEAITASRGDLIALATKYYAVR